MQKAKCLRQRTSTTIDLSPGKRKRDLPWKVQNPFKEGQENLISLKLFEN
jgi:hypothetical protein